MSRENGERAGADSTRLIRWRCVCSEDRRTNLEKLDDAGLVTDLVFEKYQKQLNKLPTELVERIIDAFNSKAARDDSELGSHLKGDGRG